MSDTTADESPKLLHRTGTEDPEIVDLIVVKTFVLNLIHVIRPVEEIENAKSDRKSEPGHAIHSSGQFPKFSFIFVR